MKLIIFFPCKKNRECKKARFFPNFLFEKKLLFRSRYGTGTITFQKSEQETEKQKIVLFPQHCLYGMLCDVYKV
jgi:hypothetical protein